MSDNSPFKFNPMALLSAGVNIYQGIAGSKARKAEQQEANRELAKRKTDLEGTDLSNPYANMENVFEDLTVNTQQADMMNQQNQQNQANIMQGLQGAAGSSGVAGLAQAMANQATLQGARISAGIGQQESRNQALRAQGAARVQQMEQQAEARVAYGDYLKEQNENQKKLNLMNLAAGQEAAQTTFDVNEQLLKNQKTSAITGGIAGVAETVFDFAQMGGFGGDKIGEATMSFPEYSMIPNNYQLGDEITGQLYNPNQHNPYSLDVELPPVFTNDQFGALGTYNPYSVNNNFTPGFNYNYINTSSNQQ